MSGIFSAPGVRRTLLAGHPCERAGGDGCCSMPTMIQTLLYGELPVIGTLKRCVATEKGWRGEDEAQGRIFDVVYDPSEPGVIARMPENGRLTMHAKNGQPIGVYLVEPLVPSPRIRKAKRRRNKRPASS